MHGRDKYGDPRKPPAVYTLPTGGTIHTRPEFAGRGYQACIDGDWRRWDRGDSEAEAIGMCIVTQCERRSNPTD